MSIETIKFKNETASKGRNGIIKTSGVEVMSSSYGVMVSPITSKCKPSDACFIEVDSEAIIETALAMLKIADNGRVKTALKDLLVREYGVVEMFWDKESIIELASNDNRRDLTEAEVDRIAQRLANADCEYGISWQTIREETLAVCPDAVSMDREEFFEDEEDMDDDSDEFHYMRANYSEEPEQ